MSLQDKLDAFKADFEGKKAPPKWSPSCTRPLLT